MIGGISKRTPMLADMIKERFNLPVRMVEIEQDTLTGLLCLGALEYERKRGWLNG